MKKTYRYIKYLRNGKTEEGEEVIRIVGTSYRVLITDGLDDSKSPSTPKVNKTKQQKVN